MPSFTVTFSGKGKRLSNIGFNSVSRKVSSVTKRYVRTSFIQSGPDKAEIHTETLLTIDQQKAVATKLGGELKEPPVQNKSRVR